ncbi:hypothetical protein AVEN_186955-1, partial [Araneus ventricosus]
MAPSLTSRPGRGLNLSNTRDVSAQNADEEKGDQLIKSTFDLLERGEKEIKFDDEHRNVILILGNTGSGKSTFTQWVAGDNTKMISKETEEGTGEYIIEDHNRIGNTTLKSKTIFPELVVDAKTNAAYYDCPGFSDTQGTSHEIATTYFIKKVVDYSESVKMVFTISHPSVRKGVDRQDFMKLMRHATDLVKDIEKFKHSIAMVATKVDNQYIKQGKNFVLVDDDKVISAIANFLQEVKQYLEDSSKGPNLSEEEKRFYENAIKFVDVLLEKDGEEYSKIGIFRRPDEPGPISDIPLLQNSKNAIERIVFERLNFTAKNNEDFGYTVSEKTKNDINELVEEINKNLWSSLSDIAGKIQEYYRNLVEQIRDKIHLFVSETNAVDVNSSEAETFRHKFSSGCNITSDLANKMKNLTNPEELALMVNSAVSNLDINIPKDDMLRIANQGKYFNFLQTISDKILNSKPWDKLFKDVGTFLYDSKAAILHDADSAVEKINNRIQLNLNSTVKDIQEEYTEKIKSLEIQKLSEKLNRDSRIIFEVTEEIKDGTTTEKLVSGIRYLADNLGVSFPKENLQNIANQGNYFMFLEVIKDQTLDVGSTTLLSPFKDIAKYFYESEKWYTFLEDLYNKLSEYGIQKDRQRYNVAALEDWGQPGKPQGIAITSNTFEKFLDKIGKYNVTEYDTIKNLTTTALQIEELNQVLSLTLKHRPILRCSEPNIIIKGSYISLKETFQNIISNIDTNNSCKNFKTQHALGKYTLLKVFALNTVFIDIDLSFSGKGTSVAVIAPKWEVIGSRSIDLRGADGDPNSDSKAKTGVNGTPGKPGGSGESFFGIGADFVSGMNLTINSNGGTGSRGQDGGDGAAGVPGSDAKSPSDSDPSCQKGYVLGLKCEEMKGRHSVVGSDGMVYSEAPYKIYGLPGGRGGNGGDGGKGAKGGDPGNITILELNQPSEITKLTTRGKEGEDGKAGAGAEGGKNGDDVIALWSYMKQGWFSRLFGQEDIPSWKLIETIKNNGRGSPGSKGTDGANALGMQNPKRANGIRRLPNIINEYKSYLRENLYDRFKKNSLFQFLDKMNNRNDVRELYDTLGLMDEFQSLEEQFHKLSEQMDFSPFYLSLLERIHKFAESNKDGEASDEYRKVLSYMYTATLGRIYSLNETKESNLITNIRGYLKLVEENIKTLKDLQMTNGKAEVINKYKENYKKGIDNKIEEARTFIKKQLNPEIQNISVDIDGQVNSLIEETIALQKQAEKEKKELDKKKKELENALAIKSLFSCFQIIGGIVSFLGPIGAIAGTVIQATSTVTESLALNTQQQTLDLPSEAVSAMKSLGDQIKIMKNQKVSYLNKLLDDVSEEIKKNPEKLNDMEGRIVEIKDRLKKASENKSDFKQVKMLEVELKQELRRKGEDLKVHSSDKKSIDALKVIGKIKQIAQFGSLLLNIYDNMKEDEEKTYAITDAVEKIEDRIKNLKEYEENIHDTIVPMLQEMEDNMKDISEKLADKSQVALDVAKWQVQSILKDMKLQMQRLTEGFQVKDDLSRCIEKLDEVMTTLINIYDRIQSFQDQQNLANYVADISSVAASSINVKNQELASATNHLEFAIRSNIVLKQYKAAIDAFKQWVFPFANRYIEKAMLPSQLVLDTNIQDLVQNAAREIDSICQKLDLYNASVKKSDQFHQHGEFSSRYVSSQPFYVWKNEEYGSLISNLLSGKEVVLKADVKDSVPRKDAIKFSLIDFYFKTKNETAQSLLSETLKGFDIRATHLGNSYYRYANKFYLITSESVPISYAFEKNDAGVPIRRNDVYEKLKSGDLILSPYTLWEVRLINTMDKYSFRDLESYRGEINLELSGFGSYVDTNVFAAAAAYKSFIVSNNTKRPGLESKATGVNQYSEPKNRLMISPVGIDGYGGYLTNVASSGMSSPINVLFNFLKTYCVSSAMISINRLFSIEQKSLSNYDDCSALPEGTEKNVPMFESNRRTTVAVKADVNSIKGDLFYNSVIIGLKFDNIFSDHFDGHNNCSKPFLLSSQQEGMSCQSIQVPELNCSLLLADLVTRTITGNKYKSAMNECVPSPPEVVRRKINDGMVRSEGDVKQNLQRLLSENENNRPRSWLS